MFIEIKHIKKSYQQSTVLDIDDFKIPSHSISAIVGPNGAGKSTLLKIIAGLEKQDEGTVLYNHQEYLPIKEMTLVFQQPYLLNTSVQKNIEYPLKIRKVDKEQRKQIVYQLCDDFHIKHLMNKNAHQLSLGEVQKVSLARALSFEPKLLMLDEPTANIDPYTTNEIEKMLIKIKEEKKTTILFVTHNLAQARRIADHVILLHQGKVIESQDVHEFFEHPKHSQTQKFIAGGLLL